jgi:serine protease Do
MDQQSNNSRHHPREILKPRRLTLLASVAALSMAVLVVGPGGYRPFNLTASAQAAEMTQNSPGFADLVTKVKPAVISVRVKIDGDGDNMPVSQRDEDGNSDQSDSPLDQFSQRFGFHGPNAMPHRHQMVTGEGSGFFISPDGYAVTNNHVVDHAKSVQVTTDDGTVYTAKVIGTDKKTDLALIKVEGKKDFT